MTSNLTEIPNDFTTGIYILFLHLKEEITINVGKLGTQIFQKGYYTYTGSALGKGATNLKNRISRHRNKQKKNFWQIDYLLFNQNVVIDNIIMASTTKKLECTTNKFLKTLAGAEVPIRRFGASDCKKDCESHLIYFPELKEKKYTIQKLLLFFRGYNETISTFVV